MRNTDRTTVRGGVLHPAPDLAAVGTSKRGSGRGRVTVLARVDLTVTAARRRRRLAALDDDPARGARREEPIGRMERCKAIDVGTLGDGLADDLPPVVVTSDRVAGDLLRNAVLVAVPPRQIEDDAGVLVVLDRVAGDGGARSSTAMMSMPWFESNRPPWSPQALLMALLAIIAAALLFIKLIATPPTWLSVLSL